MPIYEYTCMKCNKVSVLQKVGASERIPHVHTAAHDVKKNMSAQFFICRERFSPFLRFGEAEATVL